MVFILLSLNLILSVNGLLALLGPVKINSIMQVKSNQLPLAK